MFFYHQRNMELENKKQSEKSVNPSAFTLKSVITKKMWEISQTAHEKSNSFEEKGQTIFNYFIEKLEQQIPCALAQLKLS
jgi:hypothetical protein